MGKIRVRLSKEEYKIRNEKIWQYYLENRKESRNKIATNFNITRPYLLRLLTEYKKLHGIKVYKNEGGVFEQKKDEVIDFYLKNRHLCWADILKTFNINKSMLGKILTHYGNNVGFKSKLKLIKERNEEIWQYYLKNRDKSRKEICKILNISINILSNVLIKKRRSLKEPNIKDKSTDIIVKRFTKNFNNQIIHDDYEKAAKVLGVNVKDLFKC